MSLDLEGDLSLERATHAALGVDHCRRYPGGRFRLGGGLVHPRLHRSAHRRHSQPDHDGGRPAAAARRAQAGHGRGAEAADSEPVLRPPRRWRLRSLPLWSTRQRNAGAGIRAADVCDARCGAAVAAEHPAGVRRPGAGVSQASAAVAAPITEPSPRQPLRPSWPPSSAELEPAEPIAGPVPVPRAKPHGPVAALHGAVPLPRPKPAEPSPSRTCRRSTVTASTRTRANSP